MNLFKKIFGKQKSTDFIASDALLEENKFWEIIALTLKKSNGDYELQQEELAKELKKGSLQDIIAFDNRFRELMGNSYNYELWGAIYIINGGCGDDSFDYFRSWMIAQGKDFYFKTLEHPETLIDLNRNSTEIEWEGVSYVAATVFEELTDQEIPSLFIGNQEITGFDWDEDDLASMFPELTKKYPDYY